MTDDSIKNYLYKKLKNNYFDCCNETTMKYTNAKSALCLIVLIISIFIVTACSETVVLSDLPGTYSGKDIVLVRYDKDGQYLYKDDMIQVSIIIGNNGEVSGMVGEAALAECKVTPNRGWLSRQLNIKTDFIINLI